MSIEIPPINPLPPPSPSVSHAASHALPPQPAPAPVYVATSANPSRLGYFSMGCLASVILMIGLPILCLLLLCASFDVKSFGDIGQSEMKEKIMLQGDVNNKVAVVEVYGVIAFKEAERVIKVLHHVRDSSSYKALVLRVNSPGGEVTASDLIYHAVNEVKQAGKPVVVMMESLAASGGYYISANADKIIANPTTLTGSIGVIMAGVNCAEGMGKIGLKPQVYTSGAFKDMLSPMREPTNEENIYIQSMVDQSYERFVNIVTEGRKLTKEQLMASHAIDGRVLSGTDAVAKGLVDSLGYFQDAVAEAKRLGNCAEAQVIRVSGQSSWDEFFEMAEARMNSSSDVKLKLEALPLPTLQPGVHYMLPVSYATGSVQ